MDDENMPKRAILPRPSDEGAGTSKASGVYSHLENESGPAKRREPVEAACRACQSRHSKCSGDRPVCEACVTRGSLCQYDSAAGQSRAAARREHLDRVETDNMSMSEILSFLQGTTPEQAQDFLVFIRSNKDADLENSKQWIRERRQMSQLERLSPLSTATTSVPSPGTDGGKGKIRDPAQIFLEGRSTSIEQSPVPLLTANSDWSRGVTVDIFRSAIQMFLHSAGGMFPGTTNKTDITNVLDELNTYADDAPFSQVVNSVSNSTQKAQLGTLCGMAAMGVLSFHSTDQQNPLPVGLADWFYSIAHSMTDTVKDEPSRMFNAGYRESAIMQAEMLKITAIKTKIVRLITADSLPDENDVGSIRMELKTVHNSLPDWMNMDSLLQDNSFIPMRQAVFYMHLFLLSAMQLLHRRMMAFHRQLSVSVNTENTKAAIRDGLVAAKMAARLLMLMHKDGYIVQAYWVCSFAAYTTSLILLQSATQKAVHAHTVSAISADLSLASIALNTLSLCSRVDNLAVEFREIAEQYFAIVHAAVGDVELSDDLPMSSMTNEDSIEYLFNIPAGGSTLHKAARDLQILIQRPLATSLEAIPARQGSSSLVSDTLISWMETAIALAPGYIGAYE